MKGGNFDAVFISNPMKALHLAAGLSGVSARIGYDRKWPLLLTRRMPDDRSSGKRHEVESNVEFLRFAGVPIHETLPVSWNLQDEEEGVAAILAQRVVDPNKPFVVIHPWASHPKKQWPPECLVALIQEIHGRYRLPAVIVGRPDIAAPSFDAVIQECSGADLTGELTLPQLAALLKRAAVLVSGDSGPVHLAASVGCHVIALFGTKEAAAGPVRWGPWGSGHKVIWKSSMDAITVDEVLEAVASYVR